MSKYNSVWVSDVHLGLRDSQADCLNDFLQRVECRNLYIVGDLIDFWQARRGWSWTIAHSRLMQTVLARAMEGTRVVYIPGNHDEIARDFQGLDFGGIRIERECIHESPDGRRFLVLHGDEFDGAVQCRVPSWLGDFAYDVLLAANRWVNHARRRMGFGYWSLANFLKTRIREAATHIERFENAAVHEARSRDLDGIICGHIHKAEICEIDGTLYCNDGDWVESGTALVEHTDGRLELIEALDEQRVLLREGRRRVTGQPAGGLEPAPQHSRDTLG